MKFVHAQTILSRRHSGKRKFSQNKGFPAVEWFTMKEILTKMFKFTLIGLNSLISLKYLKNAWLQSTIFWVRCIYFPYTCFIDSSRNFRFLTNPFAQYKHTLTLQNGDLWQNEFTSHGGISLKFFFYSICTSVARQNKVEIF